MKYRSERRCRGFEIIKEFSTECYFDDDSNESIHFIQVQDTDELASIVCLFGVVN